MIHPDATIAESVQFGHFNVIGKVVIGDDVVIEHFCIIEDDVIIGSGTRLRNHVELRSGTRIGRRCNIDSGVKSSGGNRIGDDVTLRYDAIVARGCDIGDGCYLSPQVMTNNVDHQGKSVGGAKLGPGCFVGTQAVLAAGIGIVAESTIGSCAFVSRDITEKGVYVGVPAKRMR